jgi:hypothetical protein
MMPVKTMATVAMTTIVPTPTAMPTRGSPNVRENAERTVREREAGGSNTSSIAGGLPSPPCTGGAATSAARNTKDGFVVPSSAVGGTDRPSIMAAGAATESLIDGLIWSSASTTTGAWRPTRCSESDRRTSIACSCRSTDRRTPRFDDQVSWDNRMATTNRPVRRKKMPIPVRPLSPLQGPDLVRRSSPSPYQHH